MPTLGPTIGSRVYGLAAILLGGVIIAWHDFTATWQPVPEALPERALFAYAAGALLLVAGLALAVRRRERTAALVVTALSLVFAAGWVGRVVAAPQVFGTWLGLAEQVAVALGGLAIVAAKQGPAAHGLRVLFGLCLLVFGAAHLIYARETAAMVPGWLPPGTRFWALATGAADIAAGLALLAGPFALLAARLATAMFVGFGLLVWLPMLVAAPTEQINWAGTAFTFAIAAAAWAVADLIARAAPPVWWRRGR